MAKSRGKSAVYQLAETCLKQIREDYQGRILKPHLSRRLAMQNLSAFLLGNPNATDEKIIEQFETERDKVLKKKGAFGVRGPKGSVFIKEINDFLTKAKKHLPAKVEKLPPSEFDKLPDETVLHVFSFLKPKDMRQVSKVSRQFHRLSQDESLKAAKPIVEPAIPVKLQLTTGDRLGSVDIPASFTFPSIVKLIRKVLNIPEKNELDLTHGGKSLNALMDNQSLEKYLENDTNALFHVDIKEPRPMNRKRR